MRHMTRGLAVLLAAVLTAGCLAGCGSGDDTIGDYSTTVVATYGSEKICLDEANFLLRYEQWINETYYWSLYEYFGYDNMWTIEVYDDGTTMADSLKASVMAQLLQTRVLAEHAADYGVELTDAQKEHVSEYVSEFLETYPAFTQFTDATEEQMEEWLQMNALANLVIQAVKEDAGVTVADEDCEEYSVEYILVELPEEDEEDADAETADDEEDMADEETAADEEDMTDEEETDSDADEETEETPVGEELAWEVYEMAQDGFTFDDIASVLGVTNNTASYLLTGETSTDTPYTASVDMEAGELQLVSDPDEGWYIISRTNDVDEEATEDLRASLLDEGQTEAFDAVYAEWSEAASKFRVKTEIWDQIEVYDKITDAVAEDDTEEEETLTGEDADEEELTDEETADGDELTDEEELTDEDETVSAEETDGESE